MRKFEDLVCDVCDQPFEYQHTLEEHFKIHTGELKEWPPRPVFKNLKKPYKCPGCNKRYKTEKQKEAHQRLKHNAKTCEICGKVFSLEKSLISHGNVHAKDIKEFSRKKIEAKYMECTLCKKTITRKFEEAHMKLHPLEEEPEKIPDKIDDIILIDDSDDEDLTIALTHHEDMEIYEDEDVILLDSDEE